MACWAASSTISDLPCKGRSGLRHLQGKSDIVEDAAQQAIGVAAGFLQQAFELSKQLEQGNKQPLETY